MELIIRNPYESFKVKRGEANRDFLTVKEIKKIEKKRIDIERLIIVRDVFVFACYTNCFSKCAVRHFENYNG